ncbi:hypothetical protein [Aporhodopirellula aestuarii]|uniref:Uncharacterized protein n=1 Tax=Aporhodopirellula aestuarii TaxID=2950107 RepID=A0ABT0UBQ0_9BACT|nr:hypothetical protein [Aporhodopirellula aestuarii]MCM2374442.1 hypothetical protein [Aporhodopirellula aestuarii]
MTNVLTVQHHYHNNNTQRSNTMPKQQLRLQLPSRPKRTGELTNTHTAEAAIESSISRQQNPGMLARLFDGGKMRQVRADLERIEQEHAQELAISRVEAAGQSRIADLHREGDRMSAEIRNRHNARSGMLAKQQAEVSSRGILDQLECEKDLLKYIAESDCSSIDKQDLMEIAEAMTSEQLKSITRDSIRLPR